MATTTKRAWTYKGEKKTAWIVRYTDKSGSRRQETFQLKRDADKYKLKVETEIENGTHVAISQSWTVKEAVDAYLKDCERRHKIGDRMSMTSLVNYRNFGERHIVPKFGAVSLVDLQPQEIQDWLNEQCLRFARGTVERMHVVLFQTIAFAMRSRRVGRNVMAEGGVRCPHRTKTRVTMPSKAEIKALLDATEIRTKADRHLCFENRKIIVGLAIFNGMRRGEISALDWEDVDLDAGLIDLKHNFSLHDGLKGPKTEAGIRKLHIVPRVLETLREIHEGRGRPKTGHVIPSQRGKRTFPTQVWFLWTTVAKRAGLADKAGKMKYHLHALRHAAASFLIEDGVGPKHIASFMGHADIKTTFNTYGHLFPEDKTLMVSMNRVSERFPVAQERRKSLQGAD